MVIVLSCEGMKDNRCDTYNGSTKNCQKQCPFISKELKEDKELYFVGNKESYIKLQNIMFPKSKIEKFLQFIKRIIEK